MIELLDGYKTYLAFAALVIVAVLDGQNIISEEWAQALYFVLTGAGFAATRSGIKKESRKVLEQVAKIEQVQNSQPWQGRK